MNAPQTISQALARLEARRRHRESFEKGFSTFLDRSFEDGKAFWEKLERNAQPVPADKIITREEMGKTWL